MEKKSFVIRDERDLSKVARYLLVNLSKTRIILLEGEMGAGKTTLVKYILESLKSTDEATSPSFSLVNEYHAPDSRIYHMDMYRLESLEEAIDIGIEEYLYSGNLCIIEWPGLIESLLPENSKRVQIEVLPDSTRKVIV